ncbi:Gypsy retrotransposon integrase-like protein 1 [Rhinocladiella similis]
MQPPSRDFEQTVALRSPESSSQPSCRDSAGRIQRHILPWPQRSSYASTPLPYSNDLSLRRYRTNVTVACDLCKVKRAKCNGKNPCSRCTSKSLACSYDQGSDGRRGRSTSNEVQGLSDKVEQYQRFFDILRTSSPTAACNILHHLRSQNDEAMDGSDLANDTNLAKVLRYAETLASRSPSPDASIPSPLAQAFRQTASVPSESNSTGATSENSSQQPGTLASLFPAAWSGNTLFDPQFNATISDDFTMFGFDISAVHTESSLPSDHEHYHHLNTTDSATINATDMSPAAGASSQMDNPAATSWHPRTATNFGQAREWLRQDMDQMERYLDSKHKRRKRDGASRRHGSK